MKYDFSKVEPIKDITFLKPGIYKLHVSKVELDEAGKTPFLNITFSGESGQVRQKFYLSEKALSNLLYLHEGYFGKPITKGFEDNLQVATYFEKALTAKKIEKPIIVGGQIADNGRLYGELPFGKFFVKEGVPFVEGEFEEDTARWKEVVRKSKPFANSSTTTDSAMLPSSSDDTVTDTTDEMPW